MSISLTYPSLESVQFLDKPLHLALGMFDGVHLGHQTVIKSAIENAKQEQSLTAVLTFDPHPSKILCPDQATQLIMPTSIKTQFLHQLGIDYVIEHPFTLDFAKIEATEFLPFLKKYLPQLVCLYVGENFRFGKRRQGDIELLINQCKQFNCSIMSAERINFNGAPISSSRIRRLLKMGSIQEVNQLLGYHYFAEGDVQIVDNQAILPWAPECRPASGRYDAILVNQKENTSVQFDYTQETGTVTLKAKSNLSTGSKIKIEWLKTNS